jgi:AraC-like DNA-binding protein
MNYCQFQPPAHLRDYVHYFWTMESPENSTYPQSFGPLVDGCPGLMFQRADEGYFFDQSGQRLPELFAYGQTVKRTALFMVGRFKTVGVCLLPHSLPSLFGVNARELTDDCLDIRLVSTGLPDQLLHAASVANQIDLIADFLWRRICQMAKPVDQLTTYALTQLIESKGNASLKALQQSLRITERSLERKFDQQVGISPKLFARVCRFQASLTQLKQGKLTKLSDIAFENGYADQSHFIRAFREFTGFAPSHYQQQPFDAINSFPSLIG